MEQIYRNVLALYKMKRKGEVFAHWTETKKQAKDTMKGNGCITVAILTMEEAYKLAYCTESSTYYEAFYSQCNTKNDDKVDMVQQLLTDWLFYYDEFGYLANYVAIEKPNDKIFRSEVKIAFYKKRIKMNAKYNFDSSYWIESIEKEQAKIDEVRQIEVKRVEYAQKMEEFSQKIEEIVVENGMTVVDKFENRNEGDMSITIQKNDESYKLYIDVKTGIIFSPHFEWKDYTIEEFKAMIEENVEENVELTKIMEKNLLADIEENVECNIVSSEKIIEEDGFHYVKAVVEKCGNKFTIEHFKGHLSYCVNGRNWFDKIQDINSFISESVNHFNDWCNWYTENDIQIE